MTDGQDKTCVYDPLLAFMAHFAGGEAAARDTERDAGATIEEKSYNFV